ncbi:MAG: hypothetical protein R3F59_37965 [Myxococcota bacterium]
MNQTAGAPAWLLVVAGVANALYSLLYGLWTLLPLLWSGWVLLSGMIDGTDVGTTIGAFVMSATVPALQLLGFVVTFGMSCVTILGGLRLNRYRSKGVVWLGILCAVGAPVLALIVNAGSAMNIGSRGRGCSTGCLLGNIPTVILLILDFIAALLAVITASSATASARSRGRERAAAGGGRARSPGPRRRGAAAGVAGGAGGARARGRGAVAGGGARRRRRAPRPAVRARPAHAALPVAGGHGAAVRPVRDDAQLGLGGARRVGTRSGRTRRASRGGCGSWGPARSAPGGSCGATRGGCGCRGGGLGLLAGGWLVVYFAGAWARSHGYNPLE